MQSDFESRAATNFDATFYHGHLITRTNNHIDILSQRQFITATFDHTDIISQRLINFANVIKCRCF